MQPENKNYKIADYVPGTLCAPDNQNGTGLCRPMNGVNMWDVRTFSSATANSR